MTLVDHATHETQVYAGVNTNVGSETKMYNNIIAAMS